MNTKKCTEKKQAVGVNSPFYYADTEVFNRRFSEGFTKVACICGKGPRIEVRRGKEKQRVDYEWMAGLWVFYHPAGRIVALIQLKASHSDHSGLEFEFSKDELRRLCKKWRVKLGGKLSFRRVVERLNKCEGRDLFVTGQKDEEARRNLFE